MPNHFSIRSADGAGSAFFMGAAVCKQFRYPGNPCQDFYKSDRLCDSYEKSISRRQIFGFHLPRSTVQPATHAELHPTNETAYPPCAWLFAANVAGPPFAR
jgi:hypothetical protein